MGMRLNHFLRRLKKIDFSGFFAIFAIFDDFW